MGAVLAAVGLLVCLATVLVALLNLPLAAMTTVVVAALLVVLGAGFLLTRKAYVVRITDDGYRVRFVRGVGVAQARWQDVDDAVTAQVAGAPCLVLRLRDGRTTTIPVQVLAVDREGFVRVVQEHLQRGHGLRRPR